MSISAKIDKGRSFPEEELISNTIEAMSNGIMELCNSLTDPYGKFIAKDAFNKIKEYNNSHPRLMYSEISTFCYGQKAEDRETFILNLRTVVDYTYSTDFANGLKAEIGLGHEEEVKSREDTAKLVLKLYDHVILANTQLNALKQSDKDVNAAVNKALIPFQEKLYREMSGQLISLIGIFTAVAFVVFGGFGALTDVFTNISSVPISKIVAMATVWGLIISNCVFVLMHYVRLLTSVKSIDVPMPPIARKPSSILSRIIITPIVYWTNLILITILMISSWIHYIDSRDLGGWLAKLVELCPWAISIAGIIIAVLFFVGGAGLFLKISHPDKDKTT